MIDATAKSRAAGKSVRSTRAVLHTQAAPRKEKLQETPVEMGLVREKIRDLVGTSAEAMVAELIESGGSGQLAVAKYLFEVAGIYPAPESEGGQGGEDSVAHALFVRMGLTSGSAA